MKCLRVPSRASRALPVLRAARTLLEAETPLRGDCGRLCGGACCRADETGENGMLLYPFEDRLYRTPIEGFAYRLVPDDTLYHGGFRLVCEGSCPRAHRPLACRLFPLRVRLQPNAAGVPGCKAELDPRSWAVCPLPEEGGLRAMRADFIAAVENAGTLLCADPTLRAAMRAEDRLLADMCHL